MLHNQNTGKIINMKRVMKQFRNGWGLLIRCNRTLKEQVNVWK
ncbi:hypothetical protein HMPREF1870_02767 [Bacteroidales bacterium KA00344]|nr:hypothetical protein HMPREF1870_02767 [Bacteroidales bacterium KA00344]